MSRVGSPWFLTHLASAGKPRDSATAVYATNHFGRQMLLQLLTEVQHLNRLRIFGWKIETIELISLFLGDELSTPGYIEYNII